MAVCCGEEGERGKRRLEDREALGVGRWRVAFMRAEELLAGKTVETTANTRLPPCILRRVTHINYKSHSHYNEVIDVTLYLL
jgi:hypothetical protein